MAEQKKIMVAKIRQTLNGSPIGFIEKWEYKHDPNDAAQTLFGRFWFIIELPNGKRIETGNDIKRSYARLKKEWENSIFGNQYKG
jgi:hypothetical protein